MSGQQADVASDAQLSRRASLVASKLLDLKVQLVHSLLEVERSANEAAEFLNGEPVVLDDYSQDKMMDQAVDVWTLGNRILSIADRYQALVGLTDDRFGDSGDAPGYPGAGAEGRGEPVRGDGPGGFFGDGDGAAQDLGPVSYDAGAAD
jgi:hypothetical protein